MQGIVFVKFQEFIEEKYGVGQWKELLQTAGFEKQTTYFRLNGYPDFYLQKLLLALSEKTGKSTNALLEEFGVYLGTYLMKTYGFMISPTWNCIDTMEHTAVQMQEVFRTLTGDKATGGDLSSVINTKRLSPTTVEIDYCSPRKMCYLFVGIARAISIWHKNEISFDHRPCMHLGSPSCKIVVKLVTPAGVPT